MKESTLSYPSFSKLFLIKSEVRLRCNLLKLSLPISRLLISRSESCIDLKKTSSLVSWITSARLTNTLTRPSLVLLKKYSSQLSLATTLSNSSPRERRSQLRLERTLPRDAQSSAFSSMMSPSLTSTSPEISLNLSK